MRISKRRDGAVLRRRDVGTGRRRWKAARIAVMVAVLAVVGAFASTALASHSTYWFYNAVLPAGPPVWHSDSAYPQGPSDLYKITLRWECATWWTDLDDAHIRFNKVSGGWVGLWLDDDYNANCAGTPPHSMLYGTQVTNKGGCQQHNISLQTWCRISQT